VLRSEVRGPQRPGERREREQHAERERASVVKDWDERDQRRPQQVARHKGAPQPEPSGGRARRDAEKRPWDDLGGHDERHPRRRAGGRQHEPRERQRRHLRTGGRDDLCNYERG
jgi:hypothetical protein